MQARINIRARSGVIGHTRISLSADPDVARREMARFDKTLIGLNIHEIQDFHSLFQHVQEVNSKSGVSSVATWLNDMFGKA